MEHVAKPLLKEAGIRVPNGVVVAEAENVRRAAASLGPCMVKAQVPAGKRGREGGVRRAETPDEASAAANDILGMTIAGTRVGALLIEEQVPSKIECYAAVISDSTSRGPLLLFSTIGGMDVEEVLQRNPSAVRCIPIDILAGLTLSRARAALDGLDLAGAEEEIIEALVRLYDVYRNSDAELVEVNPLAITAKGEVVALDCKLAVDDASVFRQADLAVKSFPEILTGLEAEAAAAGLKYIELGGSVGVLANGAGLTMATMDAISHFGGEPANFLEIGGEAYTSATEALKIVLRNPKVRSLIANFCGAFARTDVMAEGVVRGWLELDPDVPVFFTIHGTGDKEAVAMVRRRLGIEPFDLMDDAVKAAVAAARKNT